MSEILRLPGRFFNEILRIYREFRTAGRALLYMTKNEVDKRWASSILGGAWNIIYPILFLGMYAVVYVMVFQIRLGELKTFDYTVLIFCGLVPYFCLAEALGTGVHSYTRNGPLLKSIAFPAEMLAVRDVLVAFWGMGFSLAILFAGLAFVGKISWFSLWVIPAVLLQLMFTIGLVWILGTLAVFIRDIGNVVNIITLFMLFVSPFAYTPDMMPEHLRFILVINPMYYLVELYREPLFFGRIPDWKILAVFGGISVFLFLGGHFFIRRLKGIIVDYV